MIQHRGFGGSEEGYTTHFAAVLKGRLVNFINSREPTFGQTHTVVDEEWWNFDMYHGVDSSGLILMMFDQEPKGLGEKVKRWPPIQIFHDAVSGCLWVELGCSFFPNSDSLGLLSLEADGRCRVQAAGLGGVRPGVPVSRWYFRSVSVLGVSIRCFLVVFRSCLCGVLAWVVSQWCLGGVS